MCHPSEPGVLFSHGSQVRLSVPCLVLGSRLLARAAPAVAALVVVAMIVAALVAVALVADELVAVAAPAVVRVALEAEALAGEESAEVVAEVAAVVENKHPAVGAEGVAYHPPEVA